MQHVVDADHPSLPGHFPGQPVVPGVVMLSSVLDEVASVAKPLRVVGIRRLKFLSRLLPGESFRVELGPARAGNLSFKCWAKEVVLAEGQAILGP